MNYQNNDINEMVEEKSKNKEMAEVVSVKRYMMYIILFSIPVVGLIVLIVKFFDKNDKNISNYAKAQLLLSLIGAVIGVIMLIFLSTYIVPNIIDELDYSDAYEEGYEFDFGDIEDYYNGSTEDDSNDTDNTIVDENSIKPIIGYIRKIDDKKYYIYPKNYNGLIDLFNERYKTNNLMCVIPLEYKELFDELEYEDKYTWSTL